MNRETGSGSEKAAQGVCLKERDRDVWALVGQGEEGLKEETFGPIAEARRIAGGAPGEGMVTAVALGTGPAEALEPLAAYGADRILFGENDALGRYHGELFARVLFGMVKRHGPYCILTVQGPDRADLSSRLAALMETALVTRAADFGIDDEERGLALRPAAGGFLFEALAVDMRTAPVVCFLPRVLSAPEPDTTRRADIIREQQDVSSCDLKTRVLRVIEAPPEALGIDEADVVVSGGRGLGGIESFGIMHDLARALGGSVGGTRPVIDRRILPPERQIGQTGKTVAPRLIFTCGISGANEFTAGMEKSRLTVAVNRDPGARIFRFADLGVIGDVHEVIPRLIARLDKAKGPD